MTEREHVEEQIREVLVTETRALTLSNRLFSPDGLFNQLAETEDQRRTVAQSPLFKQAQKRFLELQQKEAAEFTQAVRQAQSALAEGSYFFKLEHTKNS